jgi:hypothetical protein
MAWNYTRAVRVGNSVRVRLEEPVRGSFRELPAITKSSNEDEAAFVLRAQGEIAGHMRVLNAQFSAEDDVTNTFRPPQGGTPGDK